MPDPVTREELEKRLVDLHAATTPETYQLLADALERAKSPTFADMAADLSRLPPDPGWQSFDPAAVEMQNDVIREGECVVPAMGGHSFVPDPLTLAAVATTADGRVLGWTDIEAARAWLAANTATDWTVWIAAGFWARERDERRKRDGQG
jgi:hypothetical protein